MILIWYWYDIDTILIWYWYALYQRRNGQLKLTPTSYEYLNTIEKVISNSCNKKSVRHGRKGKEGEGRESKGISAILVVSVVIPAVESSKYILHHRYPFTSPSLQLLQALHMWINICSCSAVCISTWLLQYEIAIWKERVPATYWYPWYTITYATYLV